MWIFKKLCNLRDRCFDIAIALPALLVFALPMLVIALIVRINLGSPILFRQSRPGLHARLFNFYKFRTMRDAFDASGEPLPDNERMTWLGEFLRRFSLDELPQLINVLKGDMRIVGPRPLLPEYINLYTPEQSRRHNVKPGITGWAQVNGRNAIGWDEKFKLDVWYVEHRSFWLDIKILWLTFCKVIKRDGINQTGHVTMEKFKGS